MPPRLSTGSAAQSPATSPRTSSACRNSSCDGSWPERQAKLTATPASSTPGRPAMSAATAGAASGRTPSRRSPRSTVSRIWMGAPGACSPSTRAAPGSLRSTRSATLAAVSSSSHWGARMSVSGPSACPASRTSEGRRLSARPAQPASSMVRPTAGSPSTHLVTPQSVSPRACRSAARRRVASATASRSMVSRGRVNPTPLRLQGPVPREPAGASPGVARATEGQGGRREGARVQKTALRRTAAGSAAGAAERVSGRGY